MSTKRKLPSKLGQPIVKPSAKIPTKQTLDDSRTIVSERSHADVDAPKANGVKEIVDLTSDSASEEEDSDEDNDADSEEGSSDQGEDAEAPEVAKQDMEMADTSENEAPLPLTEPSFGDMLAQPSSPINVAAAFSPPTLPQAPTTALSLAPGTSLSTVLAQALKTNDAPLLESVLQTPSIPTIRSTIQRLSSPLASTLLSHLATRLHRRPGRAGTLMVWIQWTLVSHGGYLATRPDLVKELAALNRVIEERARGLNSLLALKGKLDLLEAQMMLRRAMREQGRGDGDESEEEGVVYVEGEEEDSEDDQGGAVGVGNLSGRINGAAEDSASEDGPEDMPTTNGIMAEGASSDEEDESDEQSLLDDEAEETDADTGDEDEVDHSDVDDDEDEEDEEEEESDAAQQPPKKMVRAGGLFSRR